MTDLALSTITNASQLESMIQMVEDSVSSPSTKRAYRRALVDLTTWFRETAQAQFSKAVVQDYAMYLIEDLGYSAGNANSRLSAIHKLARVASDNEVISELIADGISRVAGITPKSKLPREGHWLSQKQAEALLEAPAGDTLRGKRDRAILAVFLGSGLRRSEVAMLTFEHIQQHKGRWAIVNLIGKGQKMRPIAITMLWRAKTWIDAWGKAAGISEGRIFRPINRGGNLRLRNTRPRMSGQAIYDVVRGYVKALHEANPAFPNASPVDLRHTYAQLAWDGGAPIKQISLSMGHKSIGTTALSYIRIEPNFAFAPCDALDLEVSTDGVDQD